MQMKIKLYLLSFILLIGFYSTTFSQETSPWEKYKFRTLSEIIKLNEAGLAQGKELPKLADQWDFISADLFHSQARVTFAGASRPISTIHQELIKHWGTSLRIDQKTLDLYENEYLFKECEKEFWIPVQKQVSEFFPKELKPNDMITLFVIHVGGRKEKNIKEFDWLFLSTEFEK
jgi:hypothetical protein